MAITALAKAIKVENETANWLKDNGYHAEVARINLEAKELQLERKRIQLVKNWNQIR